MSLDNPIVANLVVAPIDRSAQAPAIAFGGDSSVLESSGTGIYGDYENVNISVAGNDVLTIDASGPSFTGDMAIDGDVVVDGTLETTSTLVLPSDVVVLVGAGAPVDGTTGDNVAGPGSMYVDTTGADLYIQTSLITTPVWKLVTRAA
jgi:hypothetical protein